MINQHSWGEYHYGSLLFVTRRLFRAKLRLLYRSWPVGRGGGGSRNHSQRATFRNSYRDINYEHNTILVKKTFRLHLRTFSYSNQHFSVKNCSFHKIKLQEKLIILSQNLISIKQLFLLEANGFFLKNIFPLRKKLNNWIN